MDNKTIVALIVVCLLFLPAVSAIVCDEQALKDCQTQLDTGTRNFQSLNSSYDSMSQDLRQANEQLAQAQQERDYYKALYENAPIGNLTVKDFLSLNQSINHYYLMMDNRIFNVDQSIGQLIAEQRNFTENIGKKVDISLTLSVTFALFTFISVGFAIWKWAFSSKKTEVKATTLVHNDFEIKK